MIEQTYNILPEVAAKIVNYVNLCNPQSACMTYLNESELFTVITVAANEIIHRDLNWLATNSPSRLNP